MSNTAIARFFDRAILLLQVALVAGIPLFFNSFTRSVFEVNKLMLLRYASILILGLWIIKALMLSSQTYTSDELSKLVSKSKKKKKDKDSTPTGEPVPAVVDTPTLAWHQKLWWFRPSGIEWILVAWGVTNIFSCIFSTNIYNAVIGAYDRWEGIWTVLNYLTVTIIFSYKITTRKQFFTILAAVVSASFLTALYGLAQSLGYDFMNWSSDPSQRIFASINNPVHYCAYVGMMVPVASGWLLYLARRHGTAYKNVLVELGTIAATLAVYYWFLFHLDWETALFTRVQYLWFGMLVVGGIIAAVGRKMRWQGTIFAMATLLYYAQVLSYSRATWMGFFAALIFFFIIVCQNYNAKLSINKVMLDVAATIFGVGTFFMLFLFRVYNISWLVGGPMVVLLLLYVGFLYYIFRSWKEVLLRVLIIFTFTQLQNVSLGFLQIGLYLAAGAGIFYLIRKRIEHKQVYAWMIILFIMYLLTPIILVLPGMWEKSFGERQTKTLIAAENLQSKVESISNIAVEGSARSSMWKSSIVWWMDYPLFGTGQDTVKYMYPKYRREDYGLLEGGHNFTPDKVHNEYFNMLITRGTFGFVIYYLGLVGFFIYVTFKGVLKNGNNGFGYLHAGLLGGAFVYLGQVFFNFGVVATLSLFYVLTALSMALVYRYDSLVEGVSDEPRYKPYFSLDAIPSKQLYAIPIVGLLTFFFVYRSALPFIAERHYREGFNAHSMATDGGRTDRFPIAEEQMRKASETFPWETHYLVQLGKIYEDWYHREDNPARKKELLDKATAVYTRCVKFQPNNPWYLNRLATMYTLYNQFTNDENERRRNLEKAEDLIVKAAAADHNNPLFQVNAGFFKQRVGKNKESLAYYQRAIAIDNQLYDAWFNLGDLYVKEHQFDEAQKVYAYVAGKVPDYENLHTNIGRMYQEMGDTGKALAAYADEIKYHPSNMQAYVNRSYIFIDRKDWRSAAAEMEMALKQDPGQIELRYNMAVAYMNLHNFGRARAELADVLRRNPGYEKARQTAAILERFSGQ